MFLKSVLIDFKHLTILHIVYTQVTYYFPIINLCHLYVFTSISLLL